MLLTMLCQIRNVKNSFDENKKTLGMIKVFKC